MRKVLFALAIATLAPLLASSSSAPARAETGVWPICLTAGEEASTRCEFATVAQCQVVSVGIRQGTCMLNPAYRSSAYAQMRPLAY